jgi:hypothetical protein
MSYMIFPYNKLGHHLKGIFESDKGKKVSFELDCQPHIKSLLL